MYGCLSCATGCTSVGVGNGGTWGVGYGITPLKMAPAPLMLNPLLLNPFMLSTTLGNKSGSNPALGGDDLLNALKTPNATLPEVSLNKDSVHSIVVVLRLE